VELIHKCTNCETEFFILKKPEGGVAAAVTAWRTARSTSALAPFIIAHARPAGLLQRRLSE
jgi:hypothetical protein